MSWTGSRIHASVRTSTIPSAVKLKWHLQQACRNIKASKCIMEPELELLWVWTVLLPACTGHAALYTYCIPASEVRSCSTMWSETILAIRNQYLVCTVLLRTSHLPVANITFKPISHHTKLTFKPYELYPLLYSLQCQISGCSMPGKEQVEEE